MEDIIMTKLSQADIMSVKGKGFLRNRGTELFSGRVIAPGTVFTAENFKDLSFIASEYGNGKLICTSRQAVEIPGIAFEDIPKAIAYAETHSLSFGGTGNKVRPVTACKGTTCVFGSFDTQALATEIHNKYYVGWKGVVLPHKFKISVGGCPNSCIKPSLNDFGIEGNRVPGKVMYRIYVGGTWGKHTRMGTPLSRLVDAEDVLPILEKSMLWFRENGYAKERFGMTIDRVGFDKLEKALFSDELIERKAEILEADIKTR